MNVIRITAADSDPLLYTLAADRGNAAQERHRDPLHPAHLALMGMAVEAASRHNVELSVCGEMAGDGVGRARARRARCPTSQHDAQLISTVKRAIRSVALTDLEHDARASPTEASAESVRARFDLLESL